MYEFLKHLMPMLPESIRSMILTPWYIGRFVQEWGKVETSTIFILSIIKGTGYEEERAVFLNLNIARQISELESLLNINAENKRVLIENYNILRKVRNDIVHGFWNGIGDNGEIIARRVDRDHSARVVEMTPQRFEKYLKDLNEHILDLMYVSRVLRDVEVNEFGERFSQIQI